MFTREYLEEQLAAMMRQADQALAAYHNANGAIAVIKHLMSQLEATQDADKAQTSEPVQEGVA